MSNTSQATAELPKPDEIEQRQRDADTARHELLMSIYERHDIAAAFFAFDKLAVGKDRDTARDALCEYDRSLLMKIDNLMALSAIAAVGASRAQSEPSHQVAAQEVRRPTIQEISDYLNGLDSLRRQVVEREARALAAAPTPPVDAVPGEPVAWMQSKATDEPCVAGAERLTMTAAWKRKLLSEGYPPSTDFANSHDVPLYAASVASRAGSEPVAGLVRMTDEDAGRVTLQFDCDESAQAFQLGHDCTVDIDEWSAALADIAPAAAAEPSELAEMEARKDAAYLERNQVVAALAKCFPSGVARTAIEGWSEDWHGCVYIDLPNNSPILGLGGEVHEIVQLYKNKPKAGEEKGRIRVSSADLDLVSGTDWHLHDAGYWIRQPHLPEPVGYLHRLIALRIFGSIPEGYEVDHIDRDTDNCARSNLRLATSEGNKLNRTVTRGHVRRRDGDNRNWEALYGTPQVRLGIFSTQKEAHDACEAHIEKIHGRVGAPHYLYPPLQVSWHFHDSQAYLFADLPPYAGAWDGHDTPEKYRRLAALQ